MGRHEIDHKAIDKLAADSPELRAELLKQAAIMARRANATLTNRQNYPDYGVGEYEYSSGVPGFAVFTRSNHAKYSNAKHNTLLQVLGGGGAGGQSSHPPRHGKPHGKRGKK